MLGRAHFWLNGPWAEKPQMELNVAWFGWVPVTAVLCLVYHMLLQISSGMRQLVRIPEALWCSKRWLVVARDTLTFFLS